VRASQQVSDPSDQTSAPRSAFTTIGPQWVIVWPFDAATTGLSAKDTGVYIALAGTAYAHLHIMGRQ
jgi:hypothetical protein